METVFLIPWMVFGSIVSCFVTTLEVRYMKKTIWGDVNKEFDTSDYVFITGMSCAGSIMWPMVVVFALLTWIFRCCDYKQLNPFYHLSTFFQKILKRWA
jgi:hypothetical protein